MSAPPPTPVGKRPVVTPGRIVAGLCLFAPFVGILWVDSYARVEPKLIGIPFFYWYQMLWVLISALLTVIAYRIVRREEAARSAEKSGEAL
ncbi:DUF3311 domain-containing protein [Streptomyces iconiensis]|uniref:DUF3311 domain-containing protein n=1 Tax=Streptomyces iconiensis TaxID=1384038 RepID=A0ABT7A2J9_9ACTN|nr:DUF3311 domain-containing protein [Streptomyces iconiensis]MDJ1135560.1 DUF3311 domain-containing protein [Streptomyces iconiensis]